MTEEDGRRTRWETHNAERRTKILDAAVAVLEREPLGAEIHVQQIGQEAGVGRTVIYRHFTDKADLDRSLRAHVLAGLGARLQPQLSATGSVSEAIRNIVRAYVQWADEHPKLHLVAERAAMSRSGDLAGTVGELTTGVTTMIRIGAAAFEVSLTEAEEASVEPLVLGLISFVHGTVHAWLHRTPRSPLADDLVDVISKSIWYQVDGHARAHGISIDPDRPIAAAAKLIT